MRWRVVIRTACNTPWPVRERSEGRVAANGRRHNIMCSDNIETTRRRKTALERRVRPAQSVEYTWRRTSLGKIPRENVSGKCDRNSTV